MTGPGLAPKRLDSNATELRSTALRAVTKTLSALLNIAGW